MSDYALDSLAKAVLPAIRKLFENEETQKDFEIWKAEYRQRQLNKKQLKKIPLNNTGMPTSVGVENGLS